MKLLLKILANWRRRREMEKVWREMARSNSRLLEGLGKRRKII